MANKIMAMGLEVDVDDVTGMLDVRGENDNMSFEKFDVLDLTEMIEYEYGNIGSVSHYKKPDLDMYDGTFN